MGHPEQSDSQRQTAGRMSPGAGSGALVFNADRVCLAKWKRSRGDVGDGGPPACVYVMLLNYTLKNGKDGKFYGIFFP